MFPLHAAIRVTSWPELALPVSFAVLTWSCSQQPSSIWGQPVALQDLAADTAQALSVSIWLQGYGGMGLSSSYSTNMVAEDQALAVIHRAKELGITHMVRCCSARLSVAWRLLWSWSK